MDWGTKWLADFSAERIQLAWFDLPNNTGAIDVKMDVKISSWKNHLLRCLGWLSLLNWIGPLTLILLLKLTPRKLEPWFVLLSSLFFLKLLCISINLPYDRAWNTVVMSGLVHQRKCRIVVLFAASREPLAHCQNVASWSVLYRYCFCSSEQAKLFPIPYSPGKSTRYFDRLHDFSVTIPRCYKHVYVYVSFLAQVDRSVFLSSGILCLQNPFLWPMI